MFCMYCYYKTYVVENGLFTKMALSQKGQGLGFGFWYFWTPLGMRISKKQVAFRGINFCYFWVFGTP